MTRRSLLLSLPLLPVLARAQEPMQRKSPHETVSLEMGGKRIQITYGRPSLKSRKAFAAGELAPSGQVWRLGADEATKLVLTVDAVFNNTLKVPAGQYALFAIPKPKEWTIILNKVADQWGAFNYSQAQDLGRFTVPIAKADGVVEQFVIKVNKTSSTALTVSLDWQDVDISFPVRFS